MVRAAHDRLAVPFTWAYNASGESTLLAVPAHAALNTGYTAGVEGLAPETLDAFMPHAALLLTVAAGIVVWRHGPRDLAPRRVVAGPRQLSVNRPTCRRARHLPPWALPQRPARLKPILNQRGPMVRHECGRELI